MRKCIHAVLAMVLISWSLSSNSQSCLQAEYPLDGNAQDISGNNLDGTVFGAIPDIDPLGNDSSAYLFDGIDDYIDLPHDFDYPVRTVSIWFNAQTIDESLGVIYASDHNDIQNGVTIMSVNENEDGKRLHYNISGAAGQGINHHFEPITENQWYMATIVFDTDEVRYYLNCQLVGAYDNLIGNSVDGSMTAKIGCSRNIDRFFHGYIDDLSVFDCALTGSEICDLYDLSPPSCLRAEYPFNGNAEDVSGNALDALVSGAIPAQDSLGNDSSAYYLDGIDDYIDFPDDYDYPVRTVNIWFNATTIDQSIDVIFTSDHNGIQNGATKMSVTQNEEGKRLWYNISGAAGQGINHHLEPINPNQWYMATVVFDTSEVRYYLNCQLVGAYDNFTGNSVNGSLTAKVGCSRNLDRFFNGYVDGLGIYDCALTEQELCGLFDLSGVILNTSALENIQSADVYPNPASDLAIIKFDNPDMRPLDLLMYNAKGKLVRTIDNIRYDQLVIRRNGLSNGIYFFQLWGKEQMEFNGKLIFH